MLGSDPAIVISDLFQASDFQPLTLFDRMNEMTRFQQRIVGAGIQPRETTTKHFYIQRFLLKVGTIDIGDLQFTALRRLDVLGNLHDLTVIEIQTRHGVAGFRLQRLLFDAQSATGSIELNDTESLRIRYVVTEYRCTLLLIGGRTKIVGEVLTVKDVIAQYQTARIVADELLADDKGLRQAIGTWLLGISQLDAVQTSISRSLRKQGKSSGVEIIRISRIPASISTDSG